MIECKNLTFYYGEKAVLQNFSLTLPDRGVVCLFGPSGCGKTTLFRLLAGLETPAGGTISGLSDKKVGVLFQEDRLLGHLTARQNIALVLSERHSDLPDRILAQMQLEQEKEQYPEHLSGGMRRRVAIGRALAYHGDILLMDEPFQGLDRELKQLIINSVLEQYKDRLIVMITHDAAEAVRMADTVYQVKGTPLELVKEFSFSVPPYQRDGVLLFEYQKNFSESSQKIV